MAPEVLIFTSGILSPLGVFMFARKLLDNKSSWLILIKISFGLAILGIVLTILETGKYNMYLALIAPLYSISIYRPLYLYFIKKINRQPIDTSMNWRPGLFYDMLFNFIYVISSTVIPMIGILILTSIIAN